MYVWLFPLNLTAPGGASVRAGEGSRTPNRLFTKQVLCRLSYASNSYAGYRAREETPGCSAGNEAEPLNVANLST